MQFGQHVLRHVLEAVVAARPDHRGGYLARQILFHDDERGDSCQGIDLGQLIHDGSGGRLRRSERVILADLLVPPRLHLREQCLVVEADGLACHFTGGRVHGETIRVLCSIFKHIWGILFELRTNLTETATMDLSEYQRKGFSTSTIDWAAAKGRQVAVLGVLGELGSLASVMKKQIRDGAVYTGARDDLIEECGDVLWYLAAIATHYGLDLGHAVAGCSSREPAAGENGHLWSLIDAVMHLNSIVAADNEFFAVDGATLEDPLGET